MAELIQNDSANIAGPTHPSTWLDPSSGKDNGHQASSIQKHGLLDVLRSYLEPSQLAFIADILESAECPPDLTLQDGLESARDIGHRVQQLDDRYRRNGKICLPKRPIQHIEFDPLHIEFSPRQYHGMPLEFYQEHRNVYEGMSRSELSRFDSGLYRALCSTGQIRRAIPKQRGRRCYA